MNIHEYQAKKILAQFDINLLDGFVANNIEEIEKKFSMLDSKVYVVKSQIHAGGRGKGIFKNDSKLNGVKIAKNKAEVVDYAKKMLGNTLITHQTGEEGKTVNSIYIEAGCEIEKELYLSFVVNRATTSISIMASREGGMDIEEVASKNEDSIVVEHINAITGITDFNCRNICFALNIEKECFGQLADMIKKLYKAFISMDLAMLEINPLVITKDKQVVPLDCKMSFDDNALFRHNDVMALRDASEEDASEMEASDSELNYIKLDGNIGCLVNGAGLAMATMDIIKLYGQSPANFLDIGGSADKERVAKAIKIILKDTNVKGILINIFGGIMRCDIVAQGIVEAAQDMNINIPIVVRLEGTNVNEGKSIIEKSNLSVMSASNLADAAEKIANIIK